MYILNSTCIGYLDGCPFCVLIMCELYLQYALHELCTHSLNTFVHLIVFFQPMIMCHTIMNSIPVLNDNLYGSHLQEILKTSPIWQRDFNLSSLLKKDFNYFKFQICNESWSYNVFMPWSSEIWSLFWLPQLFVQFKFST